MGLLAAHDKRVTEAKEENAALNQATSAFVSDANTIFDALNKGDITPQAAIAAVTDVRAWFWQYIKPFVQPGCNNDRSQCASLTSKAACGAAGTAQPTKCSKPCCATCCVACNFFEPAWNDMLTVISKGGGTVSWCQVGGNQYGYTGLKAGSVKYTKPKVTNAEAEVTLNVKTGTVTVGAAPSSQDVVIASGVVSTTSAPDQGGDVIVHNAAGQDVGVTNAPISSQLLLIGAAVVVGIIAFMAVKK